MKKNIIIFFCLFLLTPIAIPALANAATETSVQIQKIDTACMQSAVSKREATIASGFSAYSSSVSSALKARATAFASAWELTSAKARNTALKAAWKAYKSSISSARSAWSKARRSSWVAFYDARKSCGANATAEDTTTHSVDATL
jgi:hypothetical protein